MKHVVAILDNIRSVYNVGSIFRTADAAGIAKLYLAGITPTPDHSRMHHLQLRDSYDAIPDKYGRMPLMEKTALSGLTAVDWEQVDDAISLIKKLKQQGYRIIALEITPTSHSIFDRSDITSSQPIALIVGHEREGVSPPLLALADEVLHIPMRGKGKSLNVAVSFGIAAYALTKPEKAA